MKEVVIRLHGPGDLWQAVPAILGFHPHDQVVHLTLDADGMLCGPVSAIPLQFLTAEKIITSVSQLRDVIARVTDARTAVVIYYSDNARGSDTTKGVLTIYAIMLEALGLQVTGLYGAPNEAAPASAEAEQISGITGPVFDSAEEMRKQVLFNPAAVDMMTGTRGLLLDYADTDEHRDEWLASMLDAHRRGEVDPDMLPGLVLCIQGIPDDHPYLAAACTMVGAVAFREGGGPLADALFMRALIGDPEYRLAQLMTHALFRGVRPVDLDTLIGASR